MHKISTWWFWLISVATVLPKWYSSAAAEQGEDIDYDAAREVVYKMPYSEWKENHQLPASDEQLEKLAARQKK